MNEFLNLTVAASVGVLVGLIFFGGLWFTTQQIATCRYPALWLPLSFLARTAIVLGAFYWVGKGQFSSMAACLVGFVISRVIIFHFTRGKDLKHAIES